MWKIFYHLIENILIQQLIFIDFLKPLYFIFNIIN